MKVKSARFADGVDVEKKRGKRWSEEGREREREREREQGSRINPRCFFWSFVFSPEQSGSWECQFLRWECGKW